MEFFFTSIARSITKLSSYAILLVLLFSCSIFTSTGDDPDATIYHFFRILCFGSVFLISMLPSHFSGEFVGEIKDGYGNGWDEGC